MENGCKVNASMIKEDLDLPVTTRTINNWFLKRDIHYSKQRQSIQLTALHKRKRVEIVSDWITENINWENTVFSDEKRFDLDGPDN